MENCETDHEEEVVEKMTSSPTSEAVEDEGLVSNSTLEKVAAAKKYIEDHYNKRMRHIQQRKERSFAAHHLFVNIPKRTIK